MPSRSPFGRAVLIVDPAAGRGEVSREMPEVERQLLARRLDYRIEEAREPGEATRLVREALAAGERFLVAVGDDLTVEQIVNGLLDDGRALAPDAVLGVVAAGSGADFPKTFGLPGDSVRAVRHLAGDRTYRIDAVRVSFQAEGGEGIRHFAGVAQAGLGAAMVSRAERLPRPLGRARRFLGFWLAMAATRPRDLVVTVNRAEWRGRAWNVVVGNCQFSAGMRISPRSFPGDGVLDVLIHHGPMSEAFTQLPKVFQGEQVPHPHIKEYRAQTVEIRADHPIPLEADGQILGTTPARFEILPEALTLKI
jgi:YegS/Rv2252/BmrU family lipid kinase